MGSGGARGEEHDVPGTAAPPRRRAAPFLHRPAQVRAGRHGRSGPRRAERARPLEPALPSGYVGLNPPCGRCSPGCFAETTDGHGVHVPLVKQC